MKPRYRRIWTPEAIQKIASRIAMRRWVLTMERLMPSGSLETHCYLHGGWAYMRGRADVQRAMGALVVDARARSTAATPPVLPRGESHD